MSEFPHCTVCQAPVSLRANNCAVCDAPAPPSKFRALPSGEIRSGEWVRFQKPPEELQELYGELVKALAPNIRVLGMAGEGGMATVFVGRDSVFRDSVIRDSGVRDSGIRNPGSRIPGQPVQRV